MSDAERLFHRSGSTASDGWQLVVTPESAGWGHAGLRIAQLAAGGRLSFDTGQDECDRAATGRRRAGHLQRRDDRTRGSAGSVQRSDRLRLRPTDVAVRSPAPTVAGSRCPTRGRRRCRSVGSRPRSASPSCGARGQSSRQVRNFGAPDVFDADSIIACEVLTPAGNWSRTRRTSTTRSTRAARRARGDLLLRDRGAEGAPENAGRRLPAGLRHARAADRCARRGTPW